MKTTIYTSFSCIIKLDGKEEKLSPNQHIQLEEEFENIVVYPLKKNCYSFVIDFEKASPLYRVIKKEDKTLIFLLDGLLVENVVCKDFNFEGIKSRVEVSQSQIEFVGNQEKKVIYLTRPIRDVKIGAFLFIDYVYFCEDDQQTLIAYNPKTNAAKIFSGNQISIEKEGFCVQKSNFEYKNIKEEYYVDKSGLKEKNRLFDILGEPTSSQLLPYKFISAIKYEDFSGAIDFLSDKLKKHLTSQNLKEYFGHVSYFFMLDPNTCFAISDNKNVLYDFLCDEDKIIEISDNLSD